MYQYLSNGGLSKTLSIVFLFLLALGSAVIVGIEILWGQPINPSLVGFITLVAGNAATVVGFHTGISGVITGSNITAPLPALPPAVSPPPPHPTV